MALHVCPHEEETHVQSTTPFLAALDLTCRVDPDAVCPADSLDTLNRSS